MQKRAAFFSSAGSVMTIDNKRRRILPSTSALVLYRLARGSSNSRNLKMDLMRINCHATAGKLNSFPIFCRRIQGVSATRRCPFCFCSSSCTSCRCRRCSSPPLSTSVVGTLRHRQNSTEEKEEEEEEEEEEEISQNLTESGVVLRRQQPNS